MWARYKLVTYIELAETQFDNVLINSDIYNFQMWLFGGQICQKSLKVVFFGHKAQKIQEAMYGFIHPFCLGWWTC